MERGADQIRLLLTTGRELLILRPQSENPGPWHLPGLMRRPTEPLDDAMARCALETAGLLIEIRATWPPLPLRVAGRTADCHLALARVVGESAEVAGLPRSVDRRWIPWAHRVEYLLETTSRELLHRYAESIELP